MGHEPRHSYCRGSHSGTNPNSSSAAERLAGLLQTNRALPFVESVPNQDYNDIRISIYGDPEMNELFVKITNGTSAFVDAVPSETTHPSMSRRVRLIGGADFKTAAQLAARMWINYRAILITTP